MEEWSRGLGELVSLDYYVVGNHNRIPTLVVPPEQAQVVRSSVDLFDALAEYDLIFHDTYAYSTGHRPEIEGYLERSSITHYPQWRKLKAFTILVDPESMAGQEQYYMGIVRDFNGCLTPNPRMPGFHCPMGVAVEDWIPDHRERDVDVCFSGDNIRKHYRGQIAQSLEQLRKEDLNVVIADKNATSTADWKELLNRSKCYIATYSSASGHWHPPTHKQKQAKALLMGALPITEMWEPAKDYLEPGIERAVFRDLDGLRGTVRYYLDPDHAEMRARTIAHGRQRVRRDHDWRVLWRRCFEHYRLPAADTQEPPEQQTLPS